MMHKFGQGSYQIDLKEVFNLSHEQIPIEEIEDMELVPNIECREYGDHVEIVGSLILYGNYKGNQDAGKLHPAEELPESFEESVLFEPLSTDRGPFSPLTKKDQLKHQIPIQITLPREKVNDLDEIYTYVSSFDYDLKTPYQIEVMASLIISGLVDKVEQVEEIPPLQDQFEFVYMSGQNGQDPMESFSQRLQFFEEQATGQQEAFTKKEDDNRKQVDIPNLQLDPPNSENKQDEAEVRSIEIEAVEEKRNQEMELSKEPENEERLPENEPEQEPEGEPQAERESKSESEREVEKERSNVIPLPHLTELERPNMTEEVQEHSEEHLEEADVRVSITNKRTRQQQEPMPSLSTFFARKAVIEKRDESEDEQDQRNGDEPIDSEEKSATYLANFMENSEEQFTRLKICIIQKDETLDEIAERYNLTVDAILRSNSSARNQVTAGQLLYIPVKG